MYIYCSMSVMSCDTERLCILYCSMSVMSCDTERLCIYTVV